MGGALTGAINEEGIEWEAKQGSPLEQQWGAVRS